MFYLLLCLTFSPLRLLLHRFALHFRCFSCSCAISHCIFAASLTFSQFHIFLRRYAYIFAASLAFSQIQNFFRRYAYIFAVSLLILALLLLFFCYTRSCAISLNFFDASFFQDESAKHLYLRVKRPRCARPVLRNEV